MFDSDLYFISFEQYLYRQNKLTPMSKEYIQIAFDFQNQNQFEILVAQLSNLGFDGFNEEEAATGINNGVGMSSILG
jgi:hypothetical protein